MASILLSGTLLDPNGDADVGAEMRFIHNSTTGSTIKGAVSLIEFPAPDAEYNFTLEYGNIYVLYRTAGDEHWHPQGVVTVNSDSTATTIPELLLATEPPTDEQLLEFQTLLADAVAAADRAETASDVANWQLTTEELIAGTEYSAEDDGFVVRTTGYSSQGDGGSGEWYKTGNTTTASQSPLDTGENTLSDASGYEFKMVYNNAVEFDTFTELEAYSGGLIGQRLICRERANAEYIVDSGTAEAGDATFANGLRGRLQLDGEEPVSKFGDATTALQNAFDRWRDLNLDFATFTPDSTVTTTQQGIKLKGTGFISSSFTDGPVIKITQRKCQIGPGPTFQTSGDRLSASYQVTTPIIQIGDDGANIPTQTTITDLDLLDNPGDALYFAGDAVGSAVYRCNIQRCRGHGIVFDDGTQVGVSLLRPGAITVNGLVVKDCGGYTIAMSPAGGNTPYRLEISNVDHTDNAWNETEIGYAMEELIHVRGQNHVLTANAGNNTDYDSTTLSNGQTRYARSAKADLIGLYGSTTRSVSINEQRVLDINDAITVNDDIIDLTVVTPFAGGDTINSFVNVKSGASLTGGSISINSDNATSAMINNSGSAIKATIDGVERVYIGTISSGFDVDSVAAQSISSSGLNIQATIIEISGEDDLADTLNFANVAGGSYPIPEGTEFTIVNLNTYTITIANAGASGVDSTFRSKDGLDITLDQDQARTFKTISGLHYEA